jgi:hypothetical protein
MSLNDETYILTCTICSRELSLGGLADNSLVSTLNNNKKPPAHTYDRKRNFKSWLERILCIDDFQIPAELDVVMCKFIKRDNLGTPYFCTKLSIDIVRDYIKELKKTTEYNKHAAKILSRYSGINPPTFSITEIHEIITFYNNIDPIIHDKQDSCTQNVINTPYCPYMIFRIIKHKWPDDLDKQRVLNFIHCKEMRTIKKFDEIWRTICYNMNPKIPFKPTKLY